MGAQIQQKISKLVKKKMFGKMNKNKVRAHGLDFFSFTFFFLFYVVAIFFLC